MKRLAFCILMVSIVAGVAPVASAKDAPIKTETVFPKTVFGRIDAECVKDPKRDFNFFNGQEPGRNDAFVDITGACVGEVAISQPKFDDIQELQCGATPKQLVVCANPVPEGDPEGGPYLTFGYTLKGKAKREAPPGETGRYQVFLQAEGDPATLIPASPTAANLSSVGSNLTYQVVFGDPGTTEQPSLGLLVIDDRTPQQFVPDSKARVVIRGSTVVFLIPKSETGVVTGVRGAAFWGSRAAQGDASLGNQDVVPGKLDGTKFGFMPYKP